MVHAALRCARCACIECEMMSRCSGERHHMRVSIYRRTTGRTIAHTKKNKNIFPGATARAPSLYPHAIGSIVCARLVCTYAVCLYAKVRKTICAGDMRVV